GGNGLLVTIEPADKVPTATDYLTENQNFLKTQEAKVLKADPPRKIQSSTPEIEQFGLDVELLERESKKKQAARMEHYMSRHQAGGALVAARLIPKDATTIGPEVERIVKSIVVTAGAQLPVAVPPPAK